MNTSIIVNAFANAERRVTDGQEPVIYVSFKRSSIFYKDTYCILVGTRKEVDLAIANAYKTVNAAKQEENFDLGDHNNLLDTPFDTWCCGDCMEKTNCDNNTSVKCGSNWDAIEHASQADLDDYINNIKPGYYPMYSIEYM